jgi:hypothetical protein
MKPSYNQPLEEALLQIQFHINTQNYGLANQEIAQLVKDYHTNASFSGWAENLRIDPQNTGEGNFCDALVRGDFEIRDYRDGMGCIFISIRKD